MPLARVTALALGLLAVAVPAAAQARLIGVRVTRQVFGNVGLSGTVRAGERRAVARVLSRPGDRVDAYLDVVCIDPTDGTRLRRRRAQAIDRRTPLRLTARVPRFAGAGCGASLSARRHSHSAPVGYRWRLEARLGTAR